MPRHTAIDRDAYAERYAIIITELEQSGQLTNATLTEAAQVANACASALPFSVAATAAATGNWEPAKQLCRGERAKRGQDSAMVLWRAIEEAVAEAHALDVTR